MAEGILVPANAFQSAVSNRLIDSLPAGGASLVTLRFKLELQAGQYTLDVGCGAGLLCEPLARLGADVTGVDAAPESVAAAQHHAEGSGLAIAYRCADVDLHGSSYCLADGIQHGQPTIA